MGVVNVAHLETGTLAGQTARTEGRETALVRYFGQRVGLVHELREGIRTEERVDDGRNGLGVNQVGRGEDFVVTDIHALANGAAHTGQTDGELIGKLLAHGSDAAVAQVVDVVHLCFRVNQLYEVLDNLRDVLARQHTDVDVGGKAELLINTVAAYLTQVVTLFREEEVIDDLPCAGIIGRVGITQLAIDVEHGFLLRITRVLLQRVKDDGVVRSGGFLVVYQDRLYPTLYNFINMLGLQNRLAVQNHLVTLDGNDFARIFVDEVLYPAFQDTGSQLPAQHLLQVGLVDLHLFRQIENLEDVLVRLETYGAEQGGNGQLLFSVYVGVHHIVDVRRKFNPRTLERDDARRIKLRAVSMDARAKEYSRRTV